MKSQKRFPFSLLLSVLLLNRVKKLSIVVPSQPLLAMIRTKVPSIEDKSLLSQQRELGSESSDSGVSKMPPSYPSPSTTLIPTTSSTTTGTLTTVEALLENKVNLFPFLY